MTDFSDSLFLPDRIKLNCLLYADDLVLLLKSKQGLQHCLNVLSTFCEKWMMNVNLKKTKTMINNKNNGNINFTQE